MPVKPHLSPAERSAIAAAAKLAHAGAKVTWRNLGRRVDYVVDGKARKVFSSPSDRVHVELCRQAAAVYRVETDKAYVERQRVSREPQVSAGEAAGGEAGAVEIAAVPDVRSGEAMPALGESGAVLPHHALGHGDEGAGFRDGSSGSGISRSA
jgi:hypothetical protein